MFTVNVVHLPFLPSKFDYTGKFRFTIVDSQKCNAIGEYIAVTHVNITKHDYRTSLTLSACRPSHSIGFQLGFWVKTFLFDWPR